MKKAIEYRKCMVSVFTPSDPAKCIGPGYETRRAVFHGWRFDIEQDTVSGAQSQSMGIVEMEDGHIITVHPSNIQFMEPPVVNFNGPEPVWEKQKPLISLLEIAIIFIAACLLVVFIYHIAANGVNIFSIDY